MKIVNKTGRTIALYIDGTWETFFADGSAAVVKESLQPYIISGIQISKYSYVGIDNLPEKQKDTLIVVDKDIAIRCWQQLRDDIVYMHSPNVRDDKHNSVGSMILVCWQNSKFS